MTTAFEFELLLSRSWDVRQLAASAPRLRQLLRNARTTENLTSLEYN